MTEKAITVQELLLWVAKTDLEVLHDLSEFMSGNDKVAEISTAILAIGFRAGRAYGAEEARNELFPKEHLPEPPLGFDPAKGC